MEAKISRIDDISEVKEYYVQGWINGKHWKYGVRASKYPSLQTPHLDIYHIITTEPLTTSERKKVIKIITDKILSDANPQTNRPNSER